MASKINLDKVKDYYIKNEISFKGLSDLFDVNVETVRKRAYKEKWQEQKDSYKAELIKDLTEQPADPEPLNMDKIQELRTQAIGKLLITLNKSIKQVLPTEITKIKILAGALSDVNKVITDIENKQGIDFNKLDNLIDNVLNAGIPEQDKEKYKVNI